MTRVRADIIGFCCENLRPEQAGTVFPLLREAIPGLTLRAWLRYARPLARLRRRNRNGGIMVLRRLAQAMPCGLFIYQRVQDLAHGAVLVAEHLIAVDLLDPEPVMRALVEELEALAQRLGCSGIRTMVIGPDAPLATRLRLAGHASRGATMWKAVDVKAE